MLALALAVLVCLTLPAAGWAETFEVTNTNDGGPGSLRQAIIDANATAGPHQVDATGISGTINLLQALPILTEDMTISGPRADRLTVRRAAATGFRVFEVDGGIAATISRLTIADGSASGGAGVKNRGDLTLREIAVTGNNGSGVGNESSGTLRIESSTISQNEVTGAAGGGVTNSGSLTITNSTISENAAADEDGAGGVFAGGIASELVLESTTLAANANPEGARNLRVGDPLLGLGLGTARLKSTIVGRPLGGGPNCGTDGPLATIASEGFNLEQGNSCGLDQDTDQPGTGGLGLGSLADNGGPTRTMAILPGSPAVDQGNAAGIATDQRGRQRRVSFPALPAPEGGDRADVGAFELQRPELALEPASLAFDAQVVDTRSVAQAVQIGNVGEAPFEVQALELDGQHADQFAIASSGCTGQLGAAATCAVEVSFRPTSQGAKAAQLVVRSDAPGAPHAVPLSGTATIDTAPPGSGGGPPTGGPPPPPGAGASLPAKLEIYTARVRPLARGAQRRRGGARLIVRGSLDRAAGGERLAVRFRSAGRRIVMRPRVRPDGQFAVSRRLRGPQRRARGGRLILRFAGNAGLRAASERVRAARRGAGLRFNRALIRGNRLIAAGRVAPGARRQVRILVEFIRPDGAPGEIAASATVDGRGRWRFRGNVPPAVRTLGAWVSATHPGRARFHGERFGWDLRP